VSVSAVFIGGAWRRSGPRSEVRNPADTDEVVAEVELANPDDVADAVTCARAALRGWNADAGWRAAALHRLALEIERAGNTIARDLVREEGKTLADASGEVARSVDTLRHFAEQAFAALGQVLPGVKPGAWTMTRRKPVGVVAAITPFNFPLLVPVWKIAPALAYGNTVVWKASELTPLTGAHLMAAYERAELPDGVLNLVTGDARTGAALTEHAAVDAVTFTGSTSVGRAIERVVAGHGRRLQSELGGSNVAIVLGDADPRAADRLLAKGAMAGAGQKCTALARAVVDVRILDAVTASLVEELARWQIGNGLDPAVAMGPLITDTAVEAMLQTVDRATREGASVLFGGRRPIDPALARGHFVEPTVLVDVAPDAHVAQVETFGPLITVHAARDATDALRTANSSRYGLNAAIITHDLPRALELADGVEAGMVHVNDVSGFVPWVPFGGIKDSGFGPFEQGSTAAEFFTSTRVVNLHGAGA